MGGGGDSVQLEGILRMGLWELNQEISTHPTHTTNPAQTCVFPDMVGTHQPSLHRSPCQ